MTRPVGLAGLGLVGAALAARLLDAGFPVIGWDVDPARRSAPDGLVTSPDFTACGTLILAVYDEDQAEAVLAALPAGPETVLCVTTCAPARAVRLAALCAARGMAFLECPLSGTSAEIRAGTATGLLAGEDAAVARAASVLDVICPRRHRVGAPGDAARMKLAVNLVLQVNRAALAEGMVLAERLGLDPAAFLRVARDSAAASRVMETKGQRMLRRDYAPESRIGQTLKDAELILAAGIAAGQALPLAAAGAALLRAAVARHGADLDSSAVIEAVRDLGGREGRGA